MPYNSQNLLGEIALENKSLTAKPSNKHLSELDSLRGLLAIWVAISHMVCLCGFDTIALPRPLDKIWAEFIYSSSAVSVFIILSGFVISYQLNRYRMSYGQFIRNRFFRIYPVYCICLLIGIASTCLLPYILFNASWKANSYFNMLIPVSNEERSNIIGHTVSHLFLINGMTDLILPYSAITILVPAWSISLEWQYYMVAPLINRMLRYPLFLVLLAVGAIYGGSFVHDLSDRKTAYLLQYLPFFLLGIFTCLIFELISGTDSENTDFRILPTFLLIFALFSNWNKIPIAIWCIVITVSIYQSKTNLIYRVLNYQKLIYLGKISYPLYLLHWPFFIIQIYFLVLLFPGIAQGAVLGILISTLPILIYFSHLMHQRIEKPMIALGKKFNRG